MPLYLTEADVERLLTPADAIAAVEECFQRLARGEVENRSRVRQKANGGAFAVMSAVDHELRFAGVKSYAWLPSGTPFVVCLFDLDRAELAAVLEADKLGQLRTGAASAVAAKYLALERASSLGVLGCGWQAESQVLCIGEAVPTIERVVAYCRTEKNLAKFCKRFGAEAGETNRDAAEQDIVVTVTTSRDP
ncbi:MAG: ornithine cyclodeaminase family protein, partial [Gaiellaceae bacterium]